MQRYMTAFHFMYRDVPLRRCVPEIAPPAPILRSAQLILSVTMDIRSVLVLHFALLTVRQVISPERWASFHEALKHFSPVFIYAQEQLTGKRFHYVPNIVPAQELASEVSHGEVVASLFPLQQPCGSR